jgi:hypothetical protein
MRWYRAIVEKFRRAKARKRARNAASDLSRQARQYEHQTRQELIDKLSGELGRPSIKLGGGR